MICMYLSLFQLDLFLPWEKWLWVCVCVCTLRGAILWSSGNFAEEYTRHRGPSTWENCRCLCWRPKGKAVWPATLIIFMGFWVHRIMVWTTLAVRMEESTWLSEMLKGYLLLQSKSPSIIKQLKSTLIISHSFVLSHSSQKTEISCVVLV